MTSLDIKHLAAEHFGVLVAGLDGKSREPNLLFARHCAMTACAVYLPYSLKAIGQDFGGRDHSTVGHAKTKVVRQIAACAEHRLKYEVFMGKVEALKASASRLEQAVGRLGVPKGMQVALKPQMASQAGGGSGLKSNSNNQRF